jgi:hypothetical protein
VPIEEIFRRNISAPFNIIQRRLLGRGTVFNGSSYIVTCVVSVANLNE